MPILFISRHTHTRIISEHFLKCFFIFFLTGKASLRLVFVLAPRGPQDGAFDLGGVGGNHAVGSLWIPPTSSQAEAPNHSPPWVERGRRGHLVGPGGEPHLPLDPHAAPLRVEHGAGVDGVGQHGDGVAEWALGVERRPKREKQERCATLPTNHPPTHPTHTIKKRCTRTKTKVPAGTHTSIHSVAYVW